MWMNLLARKAPHLSFKTLLYQKREFSSEIFVSRLSFYTTDDELRKAFSRFGSVKEVRLIRDGKTQRPKGYAFVAYSSEPEALKAVKAMDGRFFGGNLIFVEIAKPSSEEGIALPPLYIMRSEGNRAIANLGLRA